MRFRSATAADLDSLVEFYGEIADAMVGTPHDCQWRRGLHPDDKMIADAVSAGQLTVADDNGTIAAAVIANRAYDDSTAPDLPWLVECPQEEAIVLHVLAAAPEYRGTGVARDLLVHVIDTARSQNMRSMRLGAASNNTPAVKLYDSGGFHRIIDAKRLYGDVLVEAITFELPL
ncbi:MAG: N-acetyltransferase [Coriobacteriaceae bacterium]|nr:N-acetyltransferase [Coriobacteriaceae bacterium]